MFFRRTIGGIYRIPDYHEMSNYDIAIVFLLSQVALGAYVWIGFRFLREKKWNR